MEGEVLRGGADDGRTRGLSRRADNRTGKGHWSPRLPDAVARRFQHVGVRRLAAGIEVQVWVEPDERRERGIDGPGDIVDADPVTKRAADRPHLLHAERDLVEIHVGPDEVDPIGRDRSDMRGLHADAIGERPERRVPEVRIPVEHLHAIGVPDHQMRDAGRIHRAELPGDQAAAGARNDDLAIRIDCVDVERIGEEERGFVDATDQPQAIEMHREATAPARILTWSVKTFRIPNRGGSTPACRTARTR